MSDIIKGNNMSDIINLPTEMQELIISYLEPHEIQNLCNAYPKKINYLCDWAKRAERNFKFPIQAFYFVGLGNLSPLEKYIIISNMIPTFNHLELLNRLASQWDFFDNDWFENIDNLIDPTSEYYQPLTEDEAEKFINNILENERAIFLDSNHLYLYTKYTETGMYFDSETKKYNPIRRNLDLKTLVRGYANDPITFLDILKNLFPSNSETHGSAQYTFKGFSEEGYPILDVDLEF